MRTEEYPVLHLEDPDLEDPENDDEVESGVDTTTGAAAENADENTDDNADDKADDKTGNDFEDDFEDVDDEVETTIDPATGFPVNHKDSAASAKRTAVEAAERFWLGQLNDPDHQEPIEQASFNLEWELQSACNGQYEATAVEFFLESVADVADPTQREICRAAWDEMRGDVSYMNIQILERRDSMVLTVWNVLERRDPMELPEWNALAADALQLESAAAVGHRNSWPVIEPGRYTPEGQTYLFNVQWLRRQVGTAENLDDLLEKAENFTDADSPLDAGELASLRQQLREHGDPAEVKELVQYLKDNYSIYQESRALTDAAAPILAAHEFHLVDPMNPKYDDPDHKFSKENLEDLAYVKIPALAAAIERGLESGQLNEAQGLMLESALGCVNWEVMSMIPFVDGRVPPTEKMTPESRAISYSAAFKNLENLLSGTPDCDVEASTEWMIAHDRQEQNDAKIYRTQVGKYGSQGNPQFRNSPGVDRE